MNITRLFSVLFLVAVLCLVGSYRDAGQASNTGSERTDVNISVNREDKEVGLRRMEIIDKVLSQDMLDRKMSMVHEIENDYNAKAKEIINSIIPPVFVNKVFTHIDVNFFSPEFEAEVNANQKVYLSFVVKKDGFDRWAKRYPSSQEALDSMKRLLSDTLRIPAGNISGVVID
ncbi:MAG TPA: hypothetical protein ENN05_12575 [Deltaproteobacteria bacterium]|nr:hypothetical protein [Deltaproteobacteria bacterium]